MERGAHNASMGIFCFSNSERDTLQDLIHEKKMLKSIYKMNGVALFSPMKPQSAGKLVRHKKLEGTV